jgi:predicted nucleic acid-binding Zn ribbon protein
MQPETIIAGEPLKKGDELYVKSQDNGPSYAYRKQKKCLHLYAYIRGEDEIPFAWCPECGSKIHLEVVITNFMDKLRKHLNKFSALGDPS